MKTIDNIKVKARKHTRHDSTKDGLNLMGGGVNPLSYHWGGSLFLSMCFQDKLFQQHHLVTG